MAINRSVEAERLRSTIAAADAERSRWARELHDETLQALGGLRVLLASTVGRGDESSQDAAMRQAIEDIELEIGNLRAIISDLRPSLLDDLGLRPAIEALIDRRRDTGMEITSELELPAAIRRRGSTRARDHDLPAGPGGAHERRQARTSEQGRVSVGVTSDEVTDRSAG